MNSARGRVVLVAFAIVCLVGASVPSQADAVAFTPQQTQEFVERLYDVVLQRRIDAPGLAENVSLALSLGDDFVRTLTEGFLLSPEFAAGFGSTPMSFVTTLYLSILNRVPTVGEVGSMAAVLDTDRSSLVLGFFDSTEYQLVVGPTINTEYFLGSRPYTLNYAEQAAYVSRLYNIFLQRDPDPVGFQHNLQLLMAGGREYIDELVTAFLTSVEFEALTSSSPQDPNKVVAALYLVLLGRTSDPTGLAHFVEQLQAGTTSLSQLVEDFMFSDEGRVILQNINDCAYLMGRPGDPVQGFSQVYTAVETLLALAPGILTVEEQQALLALQQCAVDRGVPEVIAVVSPTSP